MSEWININDGLPPVGMPIIVTINDTFRNRRELRYPVIYRKRFYANSPEPYKGEVKE